MVSFLRCGYWSPESRHIETHEMKHPDPFNLISKTNYSISSFQVCGVITHIVTVHITKYCVVSIVCYLSFSLLP